MLPSRANLATIEQKNSNMTFIDNSISAIGVK